MTIIATVKVKTVYLSIAALALIPITVIIGIIAGKLLEDSMYFRVYGNFIYLLVFIGPLPIIIKYLSYLRNSGILIEKFENKIFLYGKQVIMINKLQIMNNNIYGKRIEIYYNYNKKEIFYQTFLNEKLEYVQNAISPLLPKM